MKKLPKYWYVLYSNKDEFDEINKFASRGWTFYPEFNRYGICNLYGRCWFDILYESCRNEAKQNNAVQLTFEEWQVLVCGKTLISKKTDLTKLLHILKYIEKYGK